MRIIAGKYRHRKIYVPLIDSIKPTKDRIREAIFSSLGDLTDKTFLDLYSGSGAMGLEAISRGSAYTVFVDNSLIAINAIKENINKLSVSEQYKLVFLDDKEALNKFKMENRSFDVIFIDPPYMFNDYEGIIAKILEYNIISSHGIIIVESNKILSIDEAMFSKSKLSKYGDIYVTTLWR